MVTVALGLMLTFALLMKLGHWSRLQAADLGWMSHQWVAAYHASQPASSL